MSGARQQWHKVPVLMSVTEMPYSRRTNEIIKFFAVAGPCCWITLYGTTTKWIDCLNQKGNDDDNDADTDDYDDDDDEDADPSVPEATISKNGTTRRSATWSQYCIRPP